MSEKLKPCPFCGSKRIKAHVELDCGDGVVVRLSRHRDRIAVTVNLTGWRRDVSVGYVGAAVCDFAPEDEDFLKQELEESKLCRSYDEGYAEAKRIFDKE